MSKDKTTPGKSRPLKPRRALLEFAPLIYVAWSDGLLTEEEVARIRERISESKLGPGVREVLDEWLDPAHPPTPAKLYELLEMMRAAGRANRGKFASLSDFGRFLARTLGRKEELEEPTPELLALREVEQALGAVGDQALKAIVGSAGAREGAGTGEVEKLGVGDNTLANSASSTSQLPNFTTSQLPNFTTSQVPAFSTSRKQLNEFIEAERLDIRRFVFSVLQRPAFAQLDKGDMRDYRERVAQACAELARLGISSYGYPPEYDGEGNIPKSIAAFETLAFHDLSLLVKFGVQFGLFGGSILQLGTRKHHERYLRDVASMELPGCFAMTESGHGSNVRDIQTTASYDIRTQEFVVDTPSRSAWKDYIGNAGMHGRMATVFAQLEVNGQQHGVHAFLVPIRDASGNALPGIHLEDCGPKIGLNGVDNGRIEFKSVRIPRDNLLDRFGSVDEAGNYASPIASASRRFFTMLGTLVAGRTSIAAASISSTKLGLSIAARHAQWRTQFGPEGSGEVPLLTYTSVQQRLLPLVARTYALDFGIHDTVRKFGVPLDNNRELEVRAAALKAAASRHAVNALQYSRELCGGQGYMWDYCIGALRADTDIFTTFEGANNVLLQLVARGLLSDLREQFEEMRIWAAVRHVTSRAGTAVTELNPLITRKTDDEHLRDPDFHANAFRYREDRLLRSVAGRLRRLIADGRDPFDAANECQDHLIKLGEAHADRLALESFQQRIARTSDAGVKDAMTSLCALYALSTMGADRAWFVESGYFETVKSKAVRSMVARLSAELAPYAVLLADAWAIPQAYLPAGPAFTNS